MKRIKKFDFFESEKEKTTIKTQKGDEITLIPRSVYGNLLECIEDWYCDDKNARRTVKLIVWRTGEDQGRTSKEEPFISQIPAFNRFDSRSILLSNYSSIKFTHVLGIIVPKILENRVKSFAKGHNFIPEIQDLGYFSGNRLLDPSLREVVLHPFERRGQVKGKTFNI